MRHRKTHQPAAIVLGCHKLGLGVIRSLGSEGIRVIGIYYNPHDMGFVSKYVSDHYRAPHPDTSRRDFIDSILDLDPSLEGSVVIPSDDATLIAVSRARDRLAQRFRVVANGWQTTRRYVEKQYTYRAAEEIGVPCPLTKIVTEVEAALALSRRFGFPCLLKPCVGHRFFETFRTKMFFLKDEHDLRRAMEQAGQVHGQMMLQEYIPGGDDAGANYNCYATATRIHAEFTARKVRLTPPHIGFPRVVRACLIPELLAHGRAIIAALGYRGFACTEFKRDARDGVYKLMEVNGRQNLSALLAVRCGMNFAHLAYLDALGLPLPDIAPQSDDDVYWIDLERDVLETLRSRSEEKYQLRALLRPYLKPHVFAVASWKDPKPLARRALHAFQLGWGKALGTAGQRTTSS